MPRNESNSPPLSVGFVNLGCAKNLVDSEMIAFSLASAGFAFAPVPEKAGIVVVNTCAFIHDAREESIDAILEACELKARGSCSAVIVAGCLPQRYGVELATALPEVDAFIGVDETGQAGDVALRLVRGERRIFAISKKSRALIEPSPDRLVFTGAPYAYIRVSEGCDRSCAFCAIPEIRGRYRSRAVKSIVAEAEALLSRGIRELNLVSHDLTYYGRDLGGGASLAHLLRELGNIGGNFWVRLLYGHPGGIRHELLETINAVPQVCRYLDLPVQHSHDAVLSAMGRKESGAKLRRLFREVREIMPDATLRTTLLTGFPGETEKRFENLLVFLKEIRFDHVGVFVFSREENTRAWKMRRPPRAAAEKRKQLLLRAQRKIVREKSRARIGSRDMILVERRDGTVRGRWIGRSRALAPEVDGTVFVKARSRRVAPGAFIEVRYVSCRGYDMEAVEA